MCFSGKEVAYYEPDARYVGWDLAITPNGVELLEGNIPPGKTLLKSHQVVDYGIKCKNGSNQ